MIKMQFSEQNFYFYPRTLKFSAPSKHEITVVEVEQIYKFYLEYFV